MKFKLTCVFIITYLVNSFKVIEIKLWNVYCYSVEQGNNKRGFAGVF